MVSGDETSWRVNGECAWLWIITTEQVTVTGSERAAAERISGGALLRPRASRRIPALVS